MTKRIYPSWSEIDNFHDQLTGGELALAHFFDDHLPKEWLIFIQPYLNGSRPDIILFNPNIGVMIYEVKDWKKSTYEFKNQNTQKHIDQVSHYKEKLIRLLPDLGENIDNNHYLYGLIKTGIYLHKIRGEDARDLFDNPNYPEIIGYDELNENNLSDIVPDCFKEKKHYINQEWINEIYFWLKPPFHQIEQTNPIELTSQQKRHAEPKSGHYRLRGAAGSGKTLVIAYRAAELASKGYKVLIITYNITLWHYIRDMIVRTPFEFEWSNITFNHFHGFCNDVLTELDVPKPKVNYFEKIIPQVLEAIEDRNIDFLKFDAIFLDEGQDYYWEWYNLLSHFLTERDELLLVCDKRQNIYHRDLNWVEGKMKKVKFRGRWRELNTIHRLPKKIGDMANEFSKTFNLDQSVEVEDYIQMKLFEAPIKPHFLWVNVPQISWLNSIKSGYDKFRSELLKKSVGHASDIVILIPTNNMGFEAVEYFKEQNIDVNHVFEDEEHAKFHKHKKAFWMGDSRIKISTIHSFKGWEANNVILFIPDQWFNDVDLDSMVYTAMTRSKENLIVLNANERYDEFSKELNTSWD